MTRSEKFLAWLVRLLPRYLVYWCGVRMIAETAMDMPERDVHSLGAVEALKHYHKKAGAL